MFEKHIPFDAQNHNWTGNREYDRMFLIAVEQNINDTIRCRGYIYLNQIYELIGHPWNPDDKNPCLKTKVACKIPHVHLSAFYTPDGMVSAVDIICM